ncbi:hypothetical protein GIHI108528_09120 [Gillisia hiemivivida]
MFRNTTEKYRLGIVMAEAIKDGFANIKNRFRKFK